MTLQKTKLQQLLELTSEADLSAPEAPPSNPFLQTSTAAQPARDPTAPRPQMPSRESAERRPTDPAPQMPMLQQIVPEGRRMSQVYDPDLPAEIGAALSMVGLVAIKAPGYWKVMLPNASQFSAGIGGAKARWQTGISPLADAAEWMREINRFWRDVHPGEPLPFGGM